MNREAIESAIQAYRTIEAQCKELISYYELELKKLDFAEDLKEETD
jgi:hypothetical protein